MVEQRGGRVDGTCQAHLAHIATLGLLQVCDGVGIADKLGQVSQEQGAHKVQERLVCLHPRTKRSDS